MTIDKKELKRKEQFRKFMKSRTPAWANIKKVKQYYKDSKRMGSMYHVDHIVPLCSPYVCGLHNEFNLQIVRDIENAKKSNHYWCDMWYEQQELEIIFPVPEQMRLF